MAEVHKGSCLCGRVQFEIAGALRAIRNCHCSQCRKQTGHYASYTAVWKRNLRFTEERGLKWYRSSEEAQRGFCGDCGSTLFFEGIGAEKTSVAAGSLESPTGLEIVGHIFVADKGDYYELEDSLPKDAQFSPPPPMPD